MKIKYQLLILTLFISGCAFANQNGKVPREVWITNWISNPVCTPPCFENITPGQSTIDEAYKQISNDPTISDVNLENIELNTREYSLLFWRRTNPVNEKYQPGVIYTDDNSSRIVNRISLNLWNGEKYTYINLDDLISIYGDPQYFFTYHEQSSCVYGVIFSDYGMVGIINLVFHGTKVKLEPLTELDYLEFFPIEMMKEHNFGFHETIVDIIPWTGYGQYLCR
jgi:hypothetical protein